MTLAQRRVSEGRRTPTYIRGYAHWWAFFKGTWRGSAFTAVLVPVLNLLALGYGLGSLVNPTGGFDGIPYVAFIGPGLLATSAMTDAINESTWPVLGAMRWDKSYHAMLATPLRARDAMLGHLAWNLTRVLMSATAFFAVLVAFGLVSGWQGVLAIPFAVLVGLAFAPLIMAFSATTENSNSFALIYRFAVIPMFLFSGAFFPVSQLPDWLAAIARATPIWSGVELCRSATTSTLTWWPALGQVGYLLLWGAVGLVLADRTFRRRLEL
jgi:lipooligosaccharide transport system permease protein